LLGGVTIKHVMAIVLGAGKGVRMKSNLPKVLHQLQGKPLISHVIDNIRDAGISDIVLVVGFRGDEVIKAVDDKVRIVWQHEQLGTGHAVLQSESALSHFRGNLLVACGDAPMIKPRSFLRLIESVNKRECGAAVLTMNIEKPDGYGRIVKDDDGNIIRIVEEKDANPEEKRIREVNTGTYVFDKDMLFAGLRTVSANNAQGEYYLPDVIQYIRENGSRVNAVVLEDSREGSGVNSREELEMLDNYFQQHRDWSETTIVK